MLSVGRAGEVKYSYIPGNDLVFITYGGNRFIGTVLTAYGCVASSIILKLRVNDF